MTDPGTPIIIDRHTDVCFSPDDNGWYLTRWRDDGSDAVSQIFPTEGEARDAYEDDEVQWEGR